MKEKLNVGTFKQYIKESIYVVTCMTFTGAFVSKEKSLQVLAEQKLLNDKVFWFQSSYDGLGEYLTAEEIHDFKLAHPTYVKMFEPQK